MTRALLLLLLMLINVGTAEAGPLYRITTLPTTSGTFSFDTGFGLNASGQIVGSGLNPAVGNVPQAFVTTPSSRTYLGGLAGPAGQSNGYAINNTGQAAGITWTASGDPRGFVSTPGGIVSLGTLGGTQSVANAINNAGQVAGWSSLPGDQQFRAFVSGPGGLTALGTLGGFSSIAYGINDAGRVAGTSYLTGNAVAHAFVTGASGALIDLGTLGGTGNSDAFAINNAGQVVGRAATASGQTHAFITGASGLVDLGSLGTDSTAFAVNNAGAVVGGSTLINGETHPFLWQDDVLSDLTTLIDPNDPFLATWQVLSWYEARGINDAGQILVNAQTSGPGGPGFHPLVLTPVTEVPEPTTIALFGAGLLGLLPWRRRRG